AAQQTRHFAEVRGNEVAPALLVRLTADRTEEVRDVPQSITVNAMQVRAVVQRVHLVHPHFVQGVRVRVDRVEQDPGLAVRERHDEIGAGGDVLEDARRIVERSRIRAVPVPQRHGGNATSVCAQRRATGLDTSAKKSWPLSSTTMKAGKSTTSIFHT